jgi:hypothetical protein
LVKQIAQMKPEKRLVCCQAIAMRVQIVDGQGLLLDPDHEGQLLFDDDPVGRIHNGLWAINPSVLSELRSPSNLWFLPCPAFLLNPCRLAGDRCVEMPTIPALYIGVQRLDKAIDQWRARFWLCDITRGYDSAGSALQAYWVQQVPSTREPDPVYRFILEPSEQLRDEALLFLRQANDKLRERLATGNTEANSPTKRTRQEQPPAVVPAESSGSKAKMVGGKQGSWAHEAPPPENERWWQTPIEGSLKELAKWADTSEQTFRQRNHRKNIWVVKQHGKKYSVYFRTEDQYNKTCRKRADSHNGT